MALLAALIPHLVDPARSGLLILAVAIAIAASLAALCLLGTSRRPAALAPPVSRASMRLPDALPETAPGEEEDEPISAPTVEELADLRARAVPGRGGALYAWRSGGHAIPPEHEPWFESVVHAYQLYVIQDCARKHWGESVAAALQDAFTRELESADPRRTRNVRRPLHSRPRRQPHLPRPP